MKVPYVRALRYGRRWLTGGPEVQVSEELLPSDGAPLEASVYRPAASRTPRPGWVVLHGITRPGRFHDSLVRFASSLAASGAVVVVPEVREWVDLRLSPERTLPVVASGLDRLESDAGVCGPMGLAGFSFGSPQVIRASVHPGFAGRLGVVAAFGGYADLRSTLRFQLTGWHEWRGRARHLRPDPYGRWIVVGNYLTSIPGYESADRVASALLELAARAGDLQIDSWDPRMDPTKGELRAGLDAEERALFDRFAPDAAGATDPRPEDDEDARWVERLVEAARRVDPDLELPTAPLRPTAPVHLLHGESDHLIPVSEAERLQRQLAPDSVRLTVTRLFAHSTEDGASGGTVDRWRENLRFLKSLDQLLRGV